MKIARRGLLIALLIGCLVAWPLLLGIERLYDEPENYTLIEDGLYLGGSTLKPPPGATAVLNLCEFKDPYQCDVVDWDPIPDGTPTLTVDWLRKKVVWIETQRNAGRTVYVHCYHGVSRSGMVVTAYLMHKHGWSRDEALAFVKTKRPQMRPNPAFMELLSAWEHDPSRARSAAE